MLSSSILISDKYIYAVKKNYAASLVLEALCARIVQQNVYSKTVSVSVQYILVVSNVYINLLLLLLKTSLCKRL